MLSLKYKILYIVRVIYMIDKQLLTKNGMAVLRLSREFILLKEGQRIETVAEYSKKLKLGRGTIQTAFQYLENTGAIKFEVKGHLGTYIESMNYRKLWEISGLGNITGVMPLPYSRRYEGLATGFYMAFEKANIQFSMAYMRGGNKRVEALLQGKYDYAVMSKLAADIIMETNDDIDVALVMDSHSFVGGHRVLFADPGKTEISDGMKIGIDSSSIDIAVLVKHECEGKNVKYMELTYNQILKSLQSKKIDAAVWSIDEIEDRTLSIPYGELKSSKLAEYNGANTKAAIVVKKSNWGIGSLVKHVIDKAYIASIQNQVLEGKIIPEY